MANEQNLKPFKKGDPRINRKGRPKSFDALRELAQQIAHEPAKDKGGKELVIGNNKVTVVEAILRQWATNPKMQQAFVEYAFGKVSQPVQHDLSTQILDMLRKGELTPSDIPALQTLGIDVPLPGIEA